jgi:integrase
MTKQKTEHVVPLSAPARQLLSEVAARGQGKQGLPTHVFLGGGSGLQQGRLKRTWAGVCKAAGITGLRIHDLRHSFASNLVSGGASLPLIGALLGHSNPKTTARYSHLYDDPLRAAVERVGAAVVAAESEPPAEPLPFPRGRR